MCGVYCAALRYNATTSIDGGEYRGLSVTVVKLGTPERVRKKTSSSIVRHGLALRDWNGRIRPSGLETTARKSDVVSGRREQALPFVVESNGADLASLFPNLRRRHASTLVFSFTEVKQVREVQLRRQLRPTASCHDNRERTYPAGDECMSSSNSTVCHLHIN